MRSPLLNSMFLSVVRSPCSRITSTPASDTAIPQACASVSRTPSRISDQLATNSGAGRLQQQRVQRLGVFERPILQGVEGADAGDREKDHDAEPAADRGPVARQMFPGKGENDQEREGPAQERQRHRRDMAGGEPADDGVAGPAQRGDAEQQIRLVGDPVRRIAGALGSEADIRKDKARFMAPRPARRWRRAGEIARPASQTPICRVHQWGRCIATMRGKRQSAVVAELGLAGVVGRRRPDA